MAAFAAAGPADAGGSSETVIEATQRGWVSETGSVQDTIGNYLARETGPGDRTHNFFVFDLSTIAGEITDARLELANPANGIPPGESGVYSVFGGQLVSGNSFQDVVDGPLWGSYAFSGPNDNGETVVLPLNDDFLDAANAADSTLFIGGSVNQSSVFGFTDFDDNPPSDTVLVLTVIPEPGTLALIGAGGLMLSRRRRNR